MPIPKKNASEPVVTMRFSFAVFLAVLAIWPVPAFAGPSDPLRLPDAEAAKGSPVKAPMTEAQKYCQNIAAAAADARYAWQSKKLTELEGQIKQRVAELEAKQAEYKDILAQHDEALKRAKDILVGIYAHVRPEGAASQLSALDDATAAAVLVQLNARQASAILSEITPERAVRLVNTISGLTPPADGKKS